MSNPAELAPEARNELDSPRRTSGAHTAIDMATVSCIGKQVVTHRSPCPAWRWRSPSRPALARIAAAMRAPLQLKAIVQRYDKQVILAPYHGMKPKIALTAWTRIDTLEAFDEARVTRFIETYRGIDHHK